MTEVNILSSEQPIAIAQHYPVSLPKGYELLEYSGNVPEISPEERKIRRQRMAKRSVAKSIRTSETLDLEDEPLKLLEVLAHPASVLDTKTGEYQDMVRVVFLLEDGKALGFISAAAIDFVNDLRYINPSLDFHDDPLTFSFRQVNTRAGNRTYAFTIIE